MVRGHRDTLCATAATAAGEPEDPGRATRAPPAMELPASQQRRDLEQRTVLAAAAEFLQKIEGRGYYSPGR